MYIIKTSTEQTEVKHLYSIIYSIYFTVLFQNIPVVTLRF